MFGVLTAKNLKAAYLKTAIIPVLLQVNVFPNHNPL